MAPRPAAKKMAFQLALKRALALDELPVEGVAAPELDDSVAEEDEMLEGEVLVGSEEAGTDVPLTLVEAVVENSTEVAWLDADELTVA